ncbi:hypothetical protein HOM50_05475 [bacterium]|nr:hypothetical protein [bacterium]MBT5015829.1 hypothetical protein [bacterium]
MKKPGNLLIELMIYITLGLWVILLSYQACAHYYGQHKQIERHASVSSHFFSTLMLLARDIHTTQSVYHIRPRSILIHNTHGKTVGWIVGEDCLVRMEGDYNVSKMAWTSNTKSLACSNINDFTFKKVKSGILISFTINNTHIEQLISLKLGAV